MQRQNVSEIARGLSFADMQRAELEGQSSAIWAMGYDVMLRHVANSGRVYD